RTHTQSSVTVLRDRSQRLDDRFCEGRNQPPRGTVRAANSGRFAVRAPPKRASGELCFPLTKTYMDGRFAVRAPPKRASGELCFPLTKTYMEVGYSEAIYLGRLSWLSYEVESQRNPAHG